MIKRQLDPARGVAEARSRRGRAGSTARAGGRRDRLGTWLLHVAARAGRGSVGACLRGGSRARPAGGVVCASVRNVTPVLALGRDPLLPPGTCDLALIVNAYHHFDDGPALLRRVTRALTASGRVVSIDWDDRETPVGPPLGRRVPLERFLRD